MMVTFKVGDRVQVKRGESKNKRGTLHHFGRTGEQWLWVIMDGEPDVTRLFCETEVAHVTDKPPRTVKETT